MFEQIDTLNEQIGNKKHLFCELEIRRILADFNISFTYSSNRIEDNSITLDETYIIINDDITVGGRTCEELLAIINHSHAFNYLVELALNNAPFDESIIKETHSIVVANKYKNRGKYRKVEVYTGSPLTPKSEEVPEKIEALVNEYNNSKKHTIEKIALFLLNFNIIEPFFDDSGMVSRLLLNFQLLKEKYPPINIEAEEKARYYNCFKDYIATGEPDKMIEFITEKLTKQLNRYSEIIVAKENIQKKEAEEGFNFIDEISNQEINKEAIDHALEVIELLNTNSALGNELLGEDNRVFRQLQIDSIPALLENGISVDVIAKSFALEPRFVDNIKQSIEKSNS